MSAWVVLLLIVASRHYGIYVVPGPDRADAWNILGALAILALSTLIVVREHQEKSGMAQVNMLVLAVLAFHEIPVIASSIAWMVEPWEVPEGMGQLSAWAGLDLARIGALVVMLALAHIVGRKTAPANSDR